MHIPFIQVSDEELLALTTVRPFWYMRQIMEELVEREALRRNLSFHPAIIYLPNHRVGRYDCRGGGAR